MNLTDQLTQTQVFSSLQPAELQRVAEMGVRRAYPAGTFVTHMGDVWPYLLLVVQGEFQAIKESRSGRSFVIENFGPGEVFWGLALFDGGAQNPAALRAASPGKLWLWPQESIADIIAWKPQVAWGLFQLMADRMSRVGEIVEELVFQPLPGRLASLLLERFDQAATDAIARDLTLDEMAARIGTTREMVCKLLYRFAGEGVIDVERTALKVKDRPRLLEIANQLKG
jgi:CRP/FNR family transcriptional regulator, cyclic AMP receptor protein